MVPSDFVRRVLFVVLVGALTLFLWQIRDVLLLFFGGILFALLLTAGAEQWTRHLRLPRGAALGLTALLVTAIVVTAIALFGVQLAAQFRELVEDVPYALDNLEDLLAQSRFGRVLLYEAQDQAAENAGASLLAAIDATLVPAFGVLATTIVVLFAGLYLAAQPALYTRGAIRLVPASRRRRGRQILAATGTALRLWLIGQLLSMLAVGLMTGLGLWALGVPSAAALGLIAGLAEFVPIVGPIFAALPAILISFPDGLLQVSYVAAFYLLVQTVEGYVLLPLVHRATVELPPVLTIFAIIAFGIVLGPLGVLFATPLAVAVLVFIRMLYMHDALGDRVRVPGAEDTGPEPAKPIAMR